MSNLFLSVTLWLFFGCLSVSVSSQQNRSRRTAIFVFGDSVYDPGNNNYLNISKLDKADYWPYGETFFSISTGRFCDGRIIPDFISMDAQLPLWRPYLEPGSHQFNDGANFAASGAGVLPETNPGAINLRLQLSYFKDVVEQLRQELGGAAAKKMLREAVYMSSVGGNDYDVFYGENSNATESEQREFVQVVIGNLTDVIKEIYELGGRKFAFQNVGPMGCLPLAKQQSGLTGDECVDGPSALARLHNSALLEATEELQSKLPEFVYSVFDFYNSLYVRIKYPSEYGFLLSNVSCCGDGANHASHCGIEPYYLCSDPSEYVFFDGAHLSEHANAQLAKLFWEGESNITRPYNLKQLFEVDKYVSHDVC